MCNCGGTTTNTICTNNDCACPIKDFSTDCILYTGDNLLCTGISQNTILTEVFTQLDNYLCDLSETVSNSFGLISVGTGTPIYKGVDGIGRKEIRSILSTNGILTVGLSVNSREVQIGLDTTLLKQFVQSNQKTYSASNVGTGASIYKQSTVTGDNTNFVFRRITSTQNSIAVVESGDDIVITTDGSETKIQAGSGMSLSGSGTFSSPYIITNTSTNIPVSISGSGATTVTGTYPNFIVSSTDTNTTYSAGLGLALSGTTFNIDNLQKVITGDYTINDGDDNYEIIIANGATPITITIQSGLKPKINVGFIQQGTADVTFVESATTINSPLSMKKIKGQNYNAYITQVGNSNVYQLVGNLKLV